MADDGNPVARRLPLGWQPAAMRLGRRALAAHLDWSQWTRTPRMTSGNPLSDIRLNHRVDDPWMRWNLPVLRASSHISACAE